MGQFLLWDGWLGRWVGLDTLGMADSVVYIYTYTWRLGGGIISWLFQGTYRFFTNHPNSLGLPVNW